MTGEQFLELRAELQSQIDDLQKQIERAYGKIHIPAISKLRPATAADIVEGNVIYYPQKPTPYFQIIDSVHFPHDDFKAYTAEDGCRYGLDGAFVRK